MERMGVGVNAMPVLEEIKLVSVSTPVDKVKLQDNRRRQDEGVGNKLMGDGPRRVSERPKKPNPLYADGRWVV